LLLSISQDLLRFRLENWAFRFRIQGVGLQESGIRSFESRGCAGLVRGIRSVESRGRAGLVRGIPAPLKVEDAQALCAASPLR
jgi:hypothetical protein